MTDHHPSARDELGDAFIADFFADWQQHGPDVIGRLRDEKPADYVRIAAAILPKERNPRPDPIDELTDAELFERIAANGAVNGHACVNPYNDGWMQCGCSTARSSTSTTRSSASAR